MKAINIYKIEIMFSYTFNESSFLIKYLHKNEVLNSAYI